MIILHNPYSKGSRDFVSAYGDQASKVIDWYANGLDVVEHLGKYPSPSAFPFIVDEATGAFAAGASTPDELDASIAAMPIELVITAPNPAPFEIDGDNVDKVIINVVKHGASSIDALVETDDGVNAPIEVTQSIPLTDNQGSLEIVSDEPGALITVYVGGLDEDPKEGAEITKIKVV
jgi:hypothetical protein